MCAFLNKKGGHLLLGVIDDGIFEGVEETQIQQLIDRLVSSIYKQSTETFP
ncbi:AlbA family DNA-binding domain-containing protein [Maribellus maritimus]|uniref:AlbA family DNA-binding domain-containing protein n=1 Tax=Maribellus maritimus TaxID=2870838 RepID=UPI00374CA0A1|nr:ATP-binding protein [Maribellus maritimus]